MSEEQNSSVFQSNLPISSKLDRARMELLDLGARNRLLNMPRSSKSAKTVEIVEEKSDDVYRLLVTEGKPFTFLAGRPDKKSGEENSQIEEDEDQGLPIVFDDSLDIAERQSNTKFQTRMTPTGLQKRLLDLYLDARTLEEEQGVNILFLALGSLKWIDPQNKENIRYAPLLLVPVRLERGTAGERFRLRVRQEDQTSNLSLETFLDRIHKLRLPELQIDDNLVPSAYFESVAQAISSKPDWSVNPDDIVLGFFSFAKFLMYRDLDPELWPSDGKLTDHEIVRSLLGDGFEPWEQMLSDDDSIDPHIPPAEMLHIVDCDSSQTLAVHDVRRGANLVIQGPPGTGKSQTIANVIASAVADGKTVLFVAEKMAALDVVKRRLDQAGVGVACLELHSSKANKRSVLDELRRTWELGSPRGEFSSSLNEALLAARNELNGHVSRLHKPFRDTGLTPFQIMGHLTRLRREGQGPVDFKLHDIESWTPNEFAKRHDALRDLTQRIEDIGQPNQHPWCGVGITIVLPTTLERLLPRIQSAATALEDFVREARKIAEQTGQSLPLYFTDIEPLSNIAAIVGAAPDIGSQALASPIWDERHADLASIIRQGIQLKRMMEHLQERVSAEALDAPVPALLESLAWLPAEADVALFDSAAALQRLLPGLKDIAFKLQAELRATGLADDIAGVARLLTLGDRVGAAPDASPEAFAATVWDHGVEQASDLVDAVADLENLRAALKDMVLESAWTTDIANARRALATKTGLTKHFSGDWRSAKALVKSILQDPATPESEMVRILDTLSKAQSALQIVREGDAFGRSAFGADWRGERSASRPLAAIVAWMRTLRGIGPEPRLIAGQLAERTEVARQTELLRDRLETIKPFLSEFWRSLGPDASELFADVPDNKIRLDRLMERASSLSEADRAVKQLLVELPSTLDDRIGRLREVVAWQDLNGQISGVSELAESAFGQRWQRQNSDWLVLARAVDWVSKNNSLRAIVARIPDRVAIAKEGLALKEAALPLETMILGLLDALETTPAELFGSNELSQVQFSALQSKLAAWIAAPEQLSKWVAYKDRADHARELGLGDFVEGLRSGAITTSAARPSFDMAYYETLFHKVAKEQPDLAKFDGQLHGKLVEEFARLDKARIKAASLQVIREHNRRIPQQGGVGPVGVLRSEMARRRGHMPIRQLMQRAGQAVQAIKPVFMMSPLSVAQFLTPGKMSFDLLVMDEASQIQPVDAIGAIARCKQVVVVGDEKQLPPTRFFAKMIGAADDGDDNEDGAQVADMESILGLFTAKGAPQRMLRWHYRSRHQSLIAISNTQFYESKLFIVPSPYTQEAGMGLRFHHVPDGIFDSGGTAANIIEARKVAEAIIAHAQTYQSLSLGVATFSVNQRRAIQEEVERLRRLNPDTEAFFHNHPNEPFFIKNLENVQGDERDVIMISVGYARSANNPLSMRFGPLGLDGGERRLNVLISRAKRRCEVFASITDEDIDLSRTSGKGVFALKLFLQYARTGRLEGSRRTSRGPDSIFEEQVAAALQEKGYQVHPQVGIAGFFIDLAVADSERPGRYLIGIECDGAAYHDSRSARDRDRLRQAVLEDHGWIIHRIWSTDWFQRPHEQLQRTIEAIEAAKRELDERQERGESAKRAVPVEVVTIDRGSVVEIGLDKPSDREAPEYEEAKPKKIGSYELHEVPLGSLTKLVEQIVSVEAPIHIDEVIARLRDAWAYQRAGSRIQGAVQQAVRLAQSRGAIKVDGSFLTMVSTVPILRDRSNATSPGLRRPEMIATSEIAAGIRKLVEMSFGATDDELVQTISRQLGFKSTSSQMRAAILRVAQGLSETDELSRSGPMWVLAENANTQKDRGVVAESHLPDDIHSAVH